MKGDFALLFLVLMISAPLAAKNNDWPKVRQDCGEVFKPSKPSPETPATPLWKRTLGCGTDFFTARPVHATVGSVVPGGGFGPGVTLHEDFNRGKWQNFLESTSIGTFQAFWTTGARFKATHDRFGKNNSARDRFALEFYGNSRGLPKMAFACLQRTSLKRRAGAVSSLGE